MASLSSGYHYGAAIAQAIRRYKYGGRLEGAWLLADLLQPLLPDGPCLLVPVPSAARALRTRGMDAMSLVLHLSSSRRRTASRSRRVAHLLRRRDRRPAQASLSARERRHLSARAFEVRLARGRLPEIPVVLVDDVVTTGATVRACAGALVLAGLGRVDVVTLARAETA